MAGVDGGTHSAHLLSSALSPNHFPALDSPPGLAAPRMREGLLVLSLPTSLTCPNFGRVSGSELGLHRISLYTENSKGHVQPLNC